LREIHTLLKAVRAILPENGSGMVGARGNASRTWLEKSPGHETDQVDFSQTFQEGFHCLGFADCPGHDRSRPFLPAFIDPMPL